MHRARSTTTVLSVILTAVALATVATPPASATQPPPQGGPSTADRWNEFLTLQVLVADIETAALASISSSPPFCDGAEQRLLTLIATFDTPAPNVGLVTPDTPGAGQPLMHLQTLMTLTSAIRGLVFESYRATPDSFQDLEDKLESARDDLRALECKGVCPRNWPYCCCARCSARPCTDPCPTNPVTP